MSGNVKVNIEENDAYISDPLSNFKNGDITVVLGHSESWLSSTAHVPDSIHPC